MIRETTVNEATWPAPSLPGAGWGSLALAVVFVALLGLAVTTLADRIERWHGPGEAEVAPREWPSRPLPREWRWSPPGLDLDGMYASSRR